MTGILEYIDVYTLQKVLDHISCPVLPQLRLGERKDFGTSDWGLTITWEKQHFFKSLFIQ